MKNRLPIEYLMFGRPDFTYGTFYFHITVQKSCIY